MTHLSPTQEPGSQEQLLPTCSDVVILCAAKMYELTEQKLHCSLCGQESVRKEPRNSLALVTPPSDILSNAPKSSGLVETQAKFPLDLEAETPMLPL